MVTEVATPIWFSAAMTPSAMIATCAIVPSSHRAADGRRDHHDHDRHEGLGQEAHHAVDHVADRVGPEHPEAQLQREQQDRVVHQPGDEPAGGVLAEPAVDPAAVGHPVEADPGQHAGEQPAEHLGHDPAHDHDDDEQNQLRNEIGDGTERAGEARTDIQRQVVCHDPPFHHYPWRSR
jgi:hypothetical protein